MGAASAILLVLITIICESAPDQLCIGARGEVAETDSFPVPPLGVYAIAGCGMDLFVNICLTVLGYVLTSGPLIADVTKADRRCDAVTSQDTSMPFTSSTSTTTEESNPGTAYPLTRERRVSIATGSSLVDMDTAPSFSRQEPIRAATTKGTGGQGDDLGYVVMNRAQQPAVVM